MSLVLGCAMLLNNRKILMNQSTWTDLKHTIKKGVLASSSALLFGVFASPSFAAPPTLEIFQAQSSSGVNGPGSSVTQTYRSNINNPNDNNDTLYTPTMSVTYTITNSVYNNSNYPNGTNNQPDLFFGGIGGGTGGGTTIVSTSLSNSMNSIGSPSNSNFSATIQNAPTGCINGNNCSSGSTGGISTVSNYGSAVFLNTAGLMNNNLSTNNRHKVGTIRAVFNRPAN